MWIAECSTNADYLILHAAIADFVPEFCINHSTVDLLAERPVLKTPQ